MHCNWPSKELFKIDSLFIFLIYYMYEGKYKYSNEN